MAISNSRPSAQSDAERARAYRQRKSAKGLKAIKIDLPPEVMAYLQALCQIHDLTLSEAVSMAVTRLMRNATQD